jgi:pimeloyl-ACP methyl ester carboxylesterase
MRPVPVLTDPVRHGWIEFGGRRLHHLDWGGSGRPIVCIHGVTSSAWVWHHVARGLGRDRRVIAPDLRGHGESGWAPHDAYRTIDHAADVAAVVTGPVDLVGSSWGALIAVAIAAQRPELVQRLVLVDIEPSFEQAEADVPARPASFADFSEAAAWWAANNPGAPPDLTRLLAAAATRPGPGGTLVPTHDPFFARRWPFRSEDWWDALDRIDAPTLVVHAEHTWVRAAVCDQMAARLRRSERVDIPGAAHVIPVDAPAALARAVASFRAAGDARR